MIPVVPDHFPLLNSGILNRSATNVVNKGIWHQHDSDVPETITVQVPGDQIAGQHLPFHLGAAALEKLLQIENASMIDVSIRRREAPVLRVGGKMRRMSSCTSL